MEQKGSLVHPDYLRFDFSHFQKVTAEEIRAIESFVNEKIRENISLVEERQLPIEEAKKRGAMALFGEKYGDVVRMIQFADSKELCGGIHVKATGEIGFFKITTESAIAAGIRRIEAISAEKAEQESYQQFDLLQELKQELKNPKDLKQSILSLQQENQKLQKELEQFKAKAAGGIKTELLQKVVQKGDVNCLIEAVDLDAGAIKNIAFQLKAEVERLFLVLASTAGAKPTLTVLISDELVAEKEMECGNYCSQFGQTHSRWRWWTGFLCDCWWEKC